MPKRLVRRKKSLIHVNGVVEAAYCRKCCKTKPTSSAFYSATDKLLDSNGYMSICKECVADIYVGFYNSEHSLDRAIYKTCRVINVIYDAASVNATISHIKTNGKMDDDRTVFGLYKAKVAALVRGITPFVTGELSVADLTFQYENSTIPEYSSEEHDFEGSEGVVEYWGDGYSADDYRFLEKELANIGKRSYSCQNKAEEFFLKQVSIKALEIEKARLEGGRGVDALLKSVQELLKNAALTPAQQTAASSGKGTETWGMFIKNIEETTPAEYYKDKELFKDFDGIGEYIKKYITCPLKNFVMGSRDFNIVDEDTTEYDDIPLELEVNNDREEGQTEQTLSE